MPTEFVCPPIHFVFLFGKIWLSWKIALVLSIVRTNGEKKDTAQGLLPSFLLTFDNCGIIPLSLSPFMSNMLKN